MAELKATVLVDNLAREGLTGEWGLSIHIEYRGRKLLLDTGASCLFAENAAALGLDPAEVEFGVLSHAHYDHSDGIPAFFLRNSRAPFFLREGSGEDCFSGEKYIGIHKGMLESWPDRIRYVSGDYALFPGATLVPHKTPGLERVGEKAGMYRMVDGRRRTEDFSHEQSLVLETERGLVIFNSCSHGGADTIIRETAQTFPGKTIYAMVGGFHLFRSTKEEVLAFARQLRDTGVERIVTGHCTGQEAFDLLKQELGSRVEQMYAGYVLEI